MDAQKEKPKFVFDPSLIEDPSTEGPYIRLTPLGSQLLIEGRLKIRDMFHELVPELTEEDIRSISYFWLEKHDLERWAGWEEAKPAVARQFPELLKAWEDYKTNARTLDAVVKNMKLRT